MSAKVRLVPVILVVLGNLVRGGGVVVEMKDPFEWLPQEERPKGLARRVNQASQLAGDFLYRWRGLSPHARPLAAIYSSHDGRVSARPLAEVSKGPNGKRQVVPFATEPRPPREQAQRATDGYREILKEATRPSKGAGSASLPFCMIGSIEFWGGSYPVRDPSAKGQGLHETPKEYKSNPSDLRILALLELALLEKDLGNVVEYRKLLMEAMDHLGATRFDYREDLRFRVHIKELSYGFARPEEGLLFHVGEEARTTGRAAEALKYYTTLIERAPGSPFAWEALAKLTALPSSDLKTQDRLKQQLLDTWPLIWGCPRPGVKLSKEAFAAQLPELLKAAAQESKEDKPER